MTDARAWVPAAFGGGLRGRVRHGSGAAIVWVHGYTLDSTIWDELWTLLPDWTHVGVDLPGHGASRALAAATPLEDVIAVLAEAVAQYDVRHVVGLSFGSIVALELALACPGAFDTLTLAAPAIGGGAVDPDVGLRYGELIALYRARGAGPWMTELWMRCPPGTFAHASPDVRARLAAIVDRHAWRELDDPERGIGALTRRPQDVRMLAFSTARPLVVIGEYELPAFRRNAETVRRVRPDAHVAQLAGAGHLCLLHAAHDAAPLLAAHFR
jgi:pimeloyl-ACP methyl ester carboxylesterase